jgi:hypothetical protein
MIQLVLYMDIDYDFELVQKLCSSKQLTSTSGAESYSSRIPHICYDLHPSDIAQRVSTVCTRTRLHD